MSTNNRKKKRTKVDTKTKEEKNVKNIDKKDRKKKSKKKHPKLRLLLKILLILFLLLCVIGAGIVAAMFFGLFGDDFEITKDELAIGTSNTIVLDKDGNEIANLSEDEKRKIITLDEMTDYLPKAYIAIEDKRYYDHNGVDIKRTAGAILGVVTGNDNGGGSTITQQLVKNITNEKARSGLEGIVRKVKEWSKAVQVERMISKNQILELYLNLIYVGGDDVHGVELGATHYFNKSAKDLDLAECAFLAGSNQSPNLYNPYDKKKDRSEAIKNRTLTVLKEMKDQGFINNEEDYNTAVAKVEAGLTFTKGNTSGNATYSYHTDAAINDIIEQIMEERNITRQLAKNYVYGSGLTIYTTQDSTIQARVEEEFAKAKYKFNGNEKNADGTLKNDHTQAGVVIIDNATSHVVAVGGDLDSKYATGLNRGTQAIRQTGSSMKIIADIVPGLQEKVITAATVYNDVWTDFGGNYKPKNYNYERGYINIRSCIKTSQNIPMVKIMKELTAKKAIEYLRKMGITTLDDQGDNTLPLSIGGLSRGISPLEMAGAYASIANDGLYTTPIFYTKVVDKNGNTILTPTQEKTRVISEQNAYITRSIAMEPTKSGGTATYCAVKGMQTCAKTGSTDDYKDRWLCGMTPYYTTACWFGYDEPEPLKYTSGRLRGVTYSVDGRNPAGQMWASIMKDIHKNLANKNFNTPKGIVRATVCSETGGIATETCTNKYSEIFTSDNMPKKCNGHGEQTICKESGKLANEYCPQEQLEKQILGKVIPKEQLGLWKTIKAPTTKDPEKIEEVCTIHTKPKEQEKPENETNTNTNTSVNNTTNTNTNTNINTNTNTNTTTNNVVTNNTTNSTANNIANNITNSTTNVNTNSVLNQVGLGNNTIQ